ncbi:MAG: hypothetical protein ACK55Z_28075, partial [bacterium]
MKQKTAQFLPFIFCFKIELNPYSPSDGTNLAYNMTPADNTFSNTCPMLVNYQSSGTAGGSIVPIATKAIVAGLYIKQPPVTSFAGLNLAASSVQHPLTNCR